MPQGKWLINIHLFEKIMRMKASIKNMWVLHQDNARCRIVISINKFLVSKNISVAPQHPYSLDLSPCDFFSF